MKIETREDLEKLEKIISVMTKDAKYTLTLVEFVNFSKCLPVLQTAIDNYKNPPKLPVVSQEEIAKKVTPIGRLPGKKK